MRLAILLGLILAAGAEAASLRGVIINITGAGVPKTLTVLKSAGPGRNEVARQMTSASGAYSFTDVAPGAYELDFQFAGFSPLSIQDLRIEAGEDKVLPTATLQLYDCGSGIAAQYLRLLDKPVQQGRISGTVVDKNDKPVVGARVGPLMLA